VPSDEANMTFFSSVPTLWIDSSSNIPFAGDAAILVSP
jgi:hypothetical protein